MVLSLLFCRTPVVHIVLVICYTVGRVGHTIAYTFGLQPWRTLVFTLANAACVAMGIHAIIGAFWIS